jgi:hypothetical protein
MSETDKTPIKIYEFTNNNQYTQREVYPNIEKPPDVPKGYCLPFDHPQYDKNEKQISSIYKIVYKDYYYNQSEPKVYTQILAGNICDDPGEFVETYFYEGGKEALLRVCIEKLPADKQLKYENSIRNKFAEYDSRQTWEYEWHKKRPPHTNV